MCFPLSDLADRVGDPIDLLLGPVGKELLGDLREGQVAEDILVTLGDASQLGLGGLEFRCQCLGVATGDRLLVAEDLLDQVRIDRAGVGAIFARM
jgi:hypothetical protein